MERNGAEMDKRSREHFTMFRCLIHHQCDTERRKKKCPGNILTRSRAGQGKESYFNIVDRKKKFPYVGITIQNPAIPKTRKRALVTNTLAYSKTLYFTDTKRFSTLSKSKSPNQAR
jgi:hypothetical protein